MTALSINEISEMQQIRWQGKLGKPAIPANYYIQWAIPPGELQHSEPLQRTSSLSLLPFQWVTGRYAATYFDSHLAYSIMLFQKICEGIVEYGKSSEQPNCTVEWRSIFSQHCQVCSPDWLLSDAWVRTALIALKLWNGIHTQLTFLLTISQFSCSNLLSSQFYRVHPICYMAPFNRHVQYPPRRPAKLYWKLPSNRTFE